MIYLRSVNRAIMQLKEASENIAATSEQLQQLEEAVISLLKNKEAEEKKTKRS